MDEGQDFVAHLARGADQSVRAVAAAVGAEGQDVDGDVFEDKFVDFHAEFGGQVEDGEVLWLLRG